MDRALDKGIDRILDETLKKRPNVMGIALVGHNSCY
jgi:hypothetical protein